jgi:hypothetical protein
MQPKSAVKFYYRSKVLFSNLLFLKKLNNSYNQIVDLKPFNNISCMTAINSI